MIPFAAGAALLLAAGSVGLWRLQVRTRNAGWADVGWAAGVGLLTVAGLAAASGDAWRRGLAAALSAAWSLRLSSHLLHRARGAEDGRFRDLRQRLGPRADTVLRRYFAAQVPLVLWFALPAAALAGDLRGLGPRDAVGAFVALAGLAGTALADRQLQAHRAAAPGEVCRTGLWRYSRHPNYFFECVFWCGWPLLAPWSPQGALALGPAAAVYLLLTRITGIPPSERRALAHHGEAYRRYQAVTSPLVPRRPLPEPGATR